jgi:hypothetical protein
MGFGFDDDDEEDISSEVEKEAAEAVEAAAEEEYAENVAGRSSSLALWLAKEGLKRDVSKARSVYRKLGKELDSPGVDRTRRKALREARRLIEQAHGINVVRPQGRPHDSVSVRVKFPNKAKTSENYPIAAVSFEKTLVPAGKGRMLPRFIEPQVGYGPQAEMEANQRLAAHLIQEGYKLEEGLKKIAARKQQTADSEKKRRGLNKKLEENKRQKQELVARHRALLTSLENMFGIESEQESVPKSSGGPKEDAPQPQIETKFKVGERVKRQGSPRAGEVVRVILPPREGAPKYEIKFQSEAKDRFFVVDESQVEKA